MECNSFHLLVMLSQDTDFCNKRGVERKGNFVSCFEGYCLLYQISGQSGACLAARNRG